MPGEKISGLSDADEDRLIRLGVATRVAQEKPLKERLQKKAAQDVQDEGVNTEAQLVDSQEDKEIKPEDEEAKPEEAERARKKKPPRTGKKKGKT